MLSKSRYVRGMNCAKSLWLAVHKREEREVSAAQEAIFASGTSVGELATSFFPGGFMALADDFPNKAAAENTARLISMGVETIYEATFIYNSTLVAVDILTKVKGQWQIFEVKSSNSAKPEHVKDAAIQFFVAKGCGVAVEKISILHFNKEYVRRGEIDVQQLFAATDITDEVLQLQADIPGNIEQLLTMLKGAEPEVEMGQQCVKPYTCDFTAYCQRFRPAEPESEPLSNTPVINESAIQKFLQQMDYPLGFLDFETIMAGVPMFDESRPWQQIPFQYSLHIDTGEDLLHREFLAYPKDDPRPDFIRQLLKETAELGTILVYNAAFEKTRLRELARDFPDYAGALSNLAESLIDLMLLFRYHYRTESMEGSYSIKMVLPAVCPDLSYDDLEIGNGGDASQIYLSLYYCDDVDYIFTRLQHLSAYCKLDTLAMVRLLRAAHASVEQI